MTGAEIHVALERGCAEFNARRYFEAHEHWELAWRALPPGPAREGLQACIMLAGVFCLLERSRADAAIRLARRALAKSVQEEAPVRIEGAEAVLRRWCEEGAESEWKASAHRLRAVLRVVSPGTLC
jgi:hypothetical protein